jgi:hypothetical protein
MRQLGRGLPLTPLVGVAEFEEFPHGHGRRGCPPCNLGDVVLQLVADFGETFAALFRLDMGIASGILGFQAFLAENLLCVLESLILPGFRH